jgi:hypothetical protein
MNIKSLLLGSAAALAAVTGARAADAVVVAEPEPMDYVRICDVYGAGYYYIPGTETCLKIGGYARYQIDFDDDDDGWRKLARAELTFTAKSETEYGTLTGHIDLRGNVYSGFIEGDVDTDGDGILEHDTPGSTFNVQHVWLSLAGLQMGMSDTLWDGDLSGENDSAGGDRLHFIRYNWVGGNGVSVSVGLEEENYNSDYVPNLAAKVAIEQGWGSVALFAAYDDDDEWNDGLPAGDEDDDEFSLKAIATFKATEQLTLEAMAIYNSGPSFYSNGYDWSLAGWAKYQVNDKLAVGAGGQFLADMHGTDLDDWNLGLVIDYAIVQNLDAKLAINYNDGDSYVDDGSFSGFLRFTRSF